MIVIGPRYGGPLFRKMLKNPTLTSRMLKVHHGGSRIAIRGARCRVATVSSAERLTNARLGSAPS